MNDKKPFRVDNLVLHNVAGHSVASRKPRSGPEQLPLPGIGAMTALEECVMYACYFFAERAGDPQALIHVTLTEFAERLAYERREAGQEGYLTFDSDVYQEIYDGLFRLYTASREYVLPFKGHVALVNARLLTEFGPVYPNGERADQDPNAINLNPYSEDLAVWAFEGRKPSGLVFRLSPSLVQGLLNKGQNIGYSLMPPAVFELRHTPGGARISTRLLVWVIRQASQTPAIHIDKLRKQLGIPGRNVSRDREGILKGLQLLKDRDVIESFEVDRQNIVRITKATSTVEDPPPAKA